MRWIQAGCATFVTGFGLACGACGGAAPPAKDATDVTRKEQVSPPTFEDDVAFLTAHGHVVMLESPTGGRVAISVKYQGRVMTSAVAAGARSLGFVHRAFIEKGQTGTKFDNYGGEDRFWLGPEGGQFGLFFPHAQGPAAFTFDAWQTPRDMQEDTWAIASRSSSEVGLTRAMKLTNAKGTPFTVDVSRTIRVLNADEATKHLGARIDAGIEWVAFESVNRITNAGEASWEPDTGLVSVWILGMFAPASDARIVVPFDPAGQGPIVNDAYFGKVPADRLAVNEKTGTLVLNADGHYRSKIGVGPARAKQVAGSYSASASLLTIVQYDEPPRGQRYVNSMWETQSDPYAGDVVNAYNDGPTEPGKPSLGGFYELETSSPAAALGPGQSLQHTHRTFHFVGPRASLEPIAQRLLGVSLASLGP